VGTGVPAGFSSRCDVNPIGNFCNARRVPARRGRRQRIKGDRGIRITSGCRRREGRDLPTPPPLAILRANQETVFCMRNGVDRSAVRKRPSKGWPPAVRRLELFGSRPLSSSIGPPCHDSLKIRSPTDFGGQRRELWELAIVITHLPPPVAVQKSNQVDTEFHKVHTEFHREGN
jgi:hypothetical protein